MPIGLVLITILNIKNMRMIGMRTINHAMIDAPALHIRFKIHVQNNIYTNLIANIKDVLGTLHVCKPTQYVFTLP